MPTLERYESFDELKNSQVLKPGLKKAAASKKQNLIKEFGALLRANRVPALKGSKNQH